MYTNDFDKMLQLYELVLESQNEKDMRRRFDLVYPIAERMIPELLRVAVAARNVVQYRDAAHVEALVQSLENARHVVV